MLQIAMTALITLLAVGCSGPRYVDYFPYHDDGTPKPKVALMKIIDSSQSGVPWDVSDELTQALYYDLMNSGELYVLSPQEIGLSWDRQESLDFFGNDMEFVNECGNADFIVALELIEHSSIEPMALVNGAPQCDQSSRALTMRVRIKVIDVRCQEPRIILYEILTNSYTISSKGEIDYTQFGWGTPGYAITPCARVHQRMINNLACRLEEVLWRAR